jgi:thiol-disulfide isomerase/thioredoxin
MYILHINSEKDDNKIDKLIKQGKQVFILVYMEGCGPCNATRPEWAKLESALKTQYSKNDNLVVVDVNKDYISTIKQLGTIDGFPTLKYIANNGKTVESYENSSVKKKDRSVNSFINWIESKINLAVSSTPTSSPQQVYSRISNSQTHRRKHYRRKTPKYRRKSYKRRPINSRRTRSRKYN